MVGEHAERPAAVMFVCFYVDLFVFPSRRILPSECSLHE